MDTLLASGRIPSPDFVKFDVHGADLDVPRMQATLRTASLVVLMDVQGNKMGCECGQFLAGAGMLFA